MIVITVVWLSVLEISQPFLFTEGDSLTGLLPAYVHNWRSLVENSTLPLVNFHQYLGITHLGQADMGVFYPPAYLAVGLSKLIFSDFYHSLEIFSYLHRISAVVIVFLLLQKLKNTKTVSFFVALFWITNPYLHQTSKFWALRNVGLVFIPFNFLILERLIRKPTFVNIVALAITKMFFAFGDVQITGILIALEGIAMIVRAWHIADKNIMKGFRSLFPYVCSLILFLLLSLVVVLPIYQAKLTSATRSGSVAYTEFLRYAVSFDNFKDAQLFLFKPNALFDVSSHIYYIGVFVFMFIPLLLIRNIRVRANKQHRVAFYGLLSLTAFLLSTSLLGYLYEMPIFSWFRGPYRYFPFFVFFLLITFSGICSTIIKNKPFWSRQAVSIILVLSLLLNVFVVYQNNSKASHIRMEIPPNIDGLNKINKDNGRVFTYKMKVKNNLYYRYLTHSFATLFNVNHLAGNPPLIPKNNYSLALKLHHTINYKKNIDKPLLDYLSSWSVKYIMTNSSKSTKRHLESFSQIKLIYQDKELSIYENTKAHPYVYELNNLNIKVPFDFGVNRLDIYPTNVQAHKLIVSLAPLPNYVIFADNKKLTKVTPDNAPIIIDVPANTKHISIRYIDPLFKIGVKVFIMTLSVIVIVYLIRYRIYKRKQDVMN